MGTLSEPEETSEEILELIRLEILFCIVRNGVDLNRDFPDRFEVEGDILHPLGNEAVETLALMQWINEGFFVASGNLHEGALVANYPWDAVDEFRQHG